MIILAADESIDEMHNFLDSMKQSHNQYDYFICNESEGKDALLHRYVAGAAPARFKILNSSSSGELLPLDIALPRNFESWYDLIPEELLSQMEGSFRMAHFFCMVFHLDFVLKKGVDSSKLKNQILKILDDIGAKYPAEHNVGHFYNASLDQSNFFRKLDPTNSFNSGIGKTSKKKNYL
tara:strand:- start:231 stop:767 length:537 start_codon:yes stop_codon:yes gene_type:complete